MLTSSGILETMPRIAICVVTFNSAPLIADLVSSLNAGAAGVDWMLVFADNASSDDTVAEIARHAPDARIVQTGANLGFAGGANAAFAAAGVQDAYLLLNADVRLHPGGVLTLFEALSPRVGIAVPRLLDAEGELIWSMRRKPTVLRAWADALLGAERVGALSALGEIVTDARRYESPTATDWAEGSTQLISADCLSACGPWDESYFLYSEEAEFDLRAADNGFQTWYEPAATATHLEGGSADSPSQWSLLIANRVRMFRRRNGAIASCLFWLGTLTREASRSLLGKATSRAAVRDLVSPRRLAQPRGPEWLAGVGASSSART